MIAVVPIDYLNVLTEKALQIAYGLSQNIHIVHVQEEHSGRDFSSEWRLDVQLICFRRHSIYPIRLDLLRQFPFIFYTNKDLSQAEADAENYNALNRSTVREHEPHKGEINGALSRAQFP
jgi:hypothetical protein